MFRREVSGQKMGPVTWFRIAAVADYHGQQIALLGFLHRKFTDQTTGLCGLKFVFILTISGRRMFYLGQHKVTVGKRRAYDFRMIQTVFRRSLAGDAAQVELMSCPEMRAKTGAGKLYRFCFERCARCFGIVEHLIARIAILIGFKEVERQVPGIQRLLRGLGMKCQQGL